MPRPGLRLAALCALAGTLALAACTEREEAEKAPVGEDGIALARKPVDALPGWTDDGVAEALPALRRSCDALLNKPDTQAVGPDGIAGTVKAWRAPCAALAGVDAGDHAGVRRVLREHFAAYAVRGREGRKGTFTGYYSATLDAAREKRGPYEHPIYREPDDLITARLGRFRADLNGERIVGRVKDGALVPYFDRAAIKNGALAGRDLAFLYADDPIDVFFLHIQGSGVARLPNGERQRVGYAASNGHDFTGIGSYLLENDMIPPSQGSMQGIRTWLKAHPAKAERVMNENARFIFFQPLDGPGPIGSQGVPLTDGRSLAVDPDRLPLGAPVWVATKQPTANAPLRRLMVAQDTGKAIQGTVRGDIYFGTGDDALAKAGRMKRQGRLWLLLPKTLEQTRVAQSG
ncbi:membrane-bound lytic murein transglycosylase A [Limimonas halophila]|uniref:peptidoglycan lytic exotransglycosylase n=1 Tax=Limimonas halophila TaxID=1082479 RepID=A0A1G7SLL8_9PROT|nr:MltA domain-containing protein [Limimonas halophila]SDG23946.1 membrane-bound lytic murein transglycosylase A [Limimonas halophila]